jgi:hypothetical protein
MVAAPLVASPLPDSLAAAAGILGAVLAAYLLWASARVNRSSGAGSGIGWVAETAAAAAAFAIGLNVSPVTPLPGPIVAQAAGMALIVLAVVPIMGRDVMRLGAGVILLVLGVSLLTAAWLGPMAPLTRLAIAALLVGVAGAASVAIAVQSTVLPAEATPPTDIPSSPAPGPSTELPAPATGSSRLPGFSRRVRP